MFSAAKNIPGGETMAPYGIILVPETGKYLIKYTAGTALLQAPFFFVADLLSGFIGIPRNGYSTPYQLANIISSIFYLCVGVIGLYYILREQYSKYVTIVTLCLIVFGTSVFHYASYDGSFSHIYSFALITIYLRVLINYKNRELEKKENVDCILIGIIFGLIVLTRVPNAIVGIIPLGFIIVKSFKRNNWKAGVQQSLIIGLISSLIFLPQIFYWFSQSGQFIFNSYLGESFNWTSPELFNFLFSIRKGVFFWSPVTLLSILGLPFLIKSNKILGILISIVIILHVYICSCWWSWWFGGGFGSRPMVDILPLLTLPLALCVQWCVAKVGKGRTLLLAGFFIFCSILLMMSYWFRFIPFDGTTIQDLVQLPIKFISLYNFFML